MRHIYLRLVLYKSLIRFVKVCDQWSKSRLGTNRHIPYIQLPTCSFLYIKLGFGLVKSKSTKEIEDLHALIYKTSKYQHAQQTRGLKAEMLPYHADTLLKRVFNSKWCLSMVVKEGAHCKG